jgi:hypothetical protein
MLAAAGSYCGNTGPGVRTCAACGSEITDPDDYFLIGYLGEPSTYPLGRFSYTHLHTSHIHDWKQASEFLTAARAVLDAEQWQGDALLKIVRDIEAGRSP